MVRILLIAAVLLGGATGARAHDLPDQVRVRPAAIGEHHFNSVSLVDDVTVCKNEPVRCDNEPGAAAGPFARLRM